MRAPTPRRNACFSDGFALNSPFLIVETGQPVASMRRHGTFPHWIRVAAGLARDEAVVANVEAGEPLPSTEGFAGVIVTGSGAMVTDRHDWSDSADSAGPLFQDGGAVGEREYAVDHRRVPRPPQ